MEEMLAVYLLDTKTNTLNHWQKKIAQGTERYTVCTYTFSSFNTVDKDSKYFNHLNFFL